MLASEAIARAAKVGGRVTLRRIRLWQLHVDQHFDIPAEGTWEVDVDINAGQALNDRNLLVEVKYVVQVDMSGAPDEERGYRIASSWLLYYELASADGVDNLDCESFAAVSGVFAAHPYQRELVQRLTGQMGFEPLVLNVMQSPTDIRAGADFEVGAATELETAIERM